MFARLSIYSENDINELISTLISTVNRIMNAMYEVTIMTRSLTKSVGAAEIKW